MYDLINFNGSPVKDTHLERIAFNRAFLYGEGFFETMRKSNGDFPLWDYHWDRIKQSADFLSVSGHPIVNKEGLYNLLIDSSDQYNNATLKLLFYTEGTGKYAGKMRRLKYMIKVDALHTPNPLWPENGLSIDISQKSIIPAKAPYGFIKKTAALPYVLADREKEDRELDELLILNTDGEVAEAIYHNIFIYVDGTFYTPPINSGCVAGTARAMLIDYFKKNDRPVLEKNLSIDDVKSADEVFLSNAIRLIQPVVKLGKVRTYPIKESQSLFENICESLFLQKDPI